MGDEEFWSVGLFIQELENLVVHLGLRQHGFFLLGQSWGGVLAGAYAAGRPAGLRKVVIASGPSDMSLYIEGTRELLNQLPEDVRKTIEECERKGDYDSPEYEEASAVFAARHVCRMDPWPQPLQDTFANLKDDPTAYLTMQGPSEFHVIGLLRSWEGWSKAHLINVPVLLTNGRFDEVQDISMKPWFDKIAKVKWVTFAHSSHMAHWEERERYMEVIGDFLNG
ncbi:proline-specific pep [Lentithecium fluviatile CBS 122367]|uniref:Proline-specific pep n=1 Tax=Lentithecium fluviatile CBS 122367 TaxID=1168545 RepID=A0A6G1IE28_9PLEO|nr:proline-specific pep [Lentithecium fluviatile CBS 122367]